MTKAVIIGSGNVAEAFARALPEAGVEVVQIFARNAERGGLLAEAAHCGWSGDPSDIAAADIYIAAVSDRAIGDVLSALTIPDTAAAVHVSGGQPLSVIPEKFARRGVLYPLQTFTAGRRVDFSEIPFFIEGSDAATTLFLREFAQRLTNHIFEIDSAQRAKIHITGVFACNFVNAMYSAGGEVASLAGVPFDILKPLIAETARKAIESGEPRRVQTGPAVRNDTVTMERHLQLLDDCGKPELKRIYETISEYIRDGKKL